MEESASGLTREERDFGFAIHLSALCAYLGVPFGTILGPLILWLWKKDSSAWLDQQGRRALDFQISATIVYAVVLVLAFVLVFVLTIASLGILGIPLALLMGLGGILVVVLHVYWTIKAALAAQRGEDYVPPITLRMLS